MSVREKLLARYRRAYEYCNARNSPGFAGRLDFVARPAYRSELAPLNGQVGRQEMVRQLSSAIRFAHVLETGTLRGASTAFFSAVVGSPVDTCESNPRFYEYAKRHLAPWRDVHVHLADSRKFLREMSSKIPPESSVLLYLDAHWEKDLPLREEVEIIVRAWPNSVAIVDDFQVPDDPGYGFDDYGPSAKLSIEYLAPALDPDWAVFYPRMPSSEETGYRRGCCVIAGPNAKAKLTGLPSLVAAG